MTTASYCEWCGVAFEHKRTQKRRCCSTKCAGQLRFKEKAAKGPVAMPNRPRTGDEIPCDVCKKVFYRMPSDIKRNRRLCSNECSKISQTKTPVIKQCANCGKELTLKPSQAGIQFCSKRCDGDSRVKRPLERMHNGRNARKDDMGYVLVYEPEHPNKSQKGWQYEHRLVAESVAGRYLKSDEHVHHLNGIKDDNRPENLQILGQNEHAAISSREYFESIAKQREELAEYKRRFGALE